MKISGNGNGGNIIVRPPFELMRAKASLHPVFSKPSRYAVTLSLAHRLSADPRFDPILRREDIRDLDQLGDQLRDRGIAGLRLYRRFIVTEDHHYFTSLISNEHEMGKSGDRVKFSQVLLQGRLTSSSIRRIDQHFQCLKEEGEFDELMAIAADPEASAECALYAIDSLIPAPGLAAQKFLLEIAREGDERRALRALHSLAERGEAHDLVDRILDQGIKLADRLRTSGTNGWDEFDLFLVMRSLALIEADNHRSAYGVFCRLNEASDKKLNEYQRRLLMMMRGDRSDQVKGLATLLRALSY